MMYVATCPLRIALFGGSTDNPYFVEKYGRGAVINFTSSLKTYITLHEDQLGFNKEGKKYLVNYSRREETNTIQEIQNDVVRVALEHFKCPPLSISMKSDAYSQGSGLASSSAYTIALIKAITMFNGQRPMTDVEICQLSYQLEIIVNKYAGYQDPYGCGIGGFKRMEFERGGNYAAGIQSNIEKIKQIASVERSDTGESLLEDDAFLKSLSETEIKAQALLMTEHRIMADIAERGHPGPASSILKSRGSNLKQEVDMLTVEAVGYYTMPLQNEARQPFSNVEKVGPDHALTAFPSYLNNRASTIYGGSDEVQRNIMAKFVLGL